MVIGARAAQAAPIVAAGSGAEPPLLTLSGAIERVTFHNPETGFCVLRVKLRGPFDLVTVVGHALMIAAGEWLTAQGAWIQDLAHGMQFKAEVLECSAPPTLEGTEKYLGSGLIPGIGPVSAKRLVAAFGAEVLDIIEAQPERLREVSGIGPKRAERIAAGWADQKVIREIMVFLHAHGVGTARAVRIYRTYGTDSVRVMTEDPYRLAREVRGIGFKTADAIAMKLGFEPSAMVRVRAGISYALAEATKQGHCGLPRPDLLALGQELLDVPQSLMAEALWLELKDARVLMSDLDGQSGVFLPQLFHAERGIADRLRALMRQPVPWGAIDAPAAISWVEEQTDLKLAPSQVKALTTALRSKVLVITGGPGVGKTTLVNSILKVLAAKGVRILLCAPTGKAAKRMSETTGLPAFTIHRLLDADPKTGKFRYHERRPLSCDLLVVDESSMIDVPLMHALLRAIPDTAAFLAVGDIDQLPSVGPGLVLSDIIESGAVPVVRLTELFRQGKESRIVAAAHAVNRGVIPDLKRAEPGSDFHWVTAETPEGAARKILEMVSKRIPRAFGLDPVREIQVLCPGKRGSAGAIALNQQLQAALNPSRERKIEAFGFTFAVGDKVMQLDNDKERGVFNGDLGFVKRVDRENGLLVVDFDGDEVSYPKLMLDTLVPAYAMSIHKSQGSEYPAVVIPVTTQHYTLLQRNLIYTAITRGKRLVILVGQPRALAMAVKNVSGHRRWSKLDEWLANTLEPIAAE